MTQPVKTPRQELEHALRNAFASAIAAYYKKFPERIDDPGLGEGTKALMALMMDVIRLLDKYEIRRRERNGRQQDNGSTHPNPETGSTDT